MIASLRDDFALPLVRTKRSTLAWGYTQTVGKRETRVGGYVDGLEAYRQFVHHCVHTERGTVPCVPDEYGVEVRQFIGKSFGFLKARVERVIREALLMDERTISVRMIECVKTELGRARVAFAIVCTEGQFDYSFELAH